MREIAGILYLFLVMVIMAGYPCLVLAEGILSINANPVLNIRSNSGATSTVFAPLSSSFSSQGCTVNIAGGNMGNSVTQGSANFAMDCDEQDGSGSFFRVFQNDNANQPHDLFSISRAGFGNAQQFLVVQGGYSTGWPNYKYWYENFAKNNIASQHEHAALTVFTDVPSTKVPVFSIWGLTNTVYPGSRPPLYQHYGNTFANAALYDATIGLSPLDGILLESLEDNGNHFTNQAVRTGAVFTNATTTLADVTQLAVPVISGRTYLITGKLYVTSATGGIKIAVNSTSTASAVIYQATCIHNAGTPAITSSGQATALASAVAASSTSLSSGALCDISGTITINSGGTRTLSATATSGNATMTMANTSGIVVGQQVVQSGVGCDVFPTSTYVVSFVSNTSVTLSTAPSCTPGGAISFNFLDTITLQAASNAAGTLTVAQGSSLKVDGSIQGATY